MNKKIKKSLAGMQKISTAICILYTLLFMGCVKKHEPIFDKNTETPTDISTRAEEDNNVYYYGYEIGKIYMLQKKDKIFLQFAPDADREQVLSIINSNAALRTMSNLNLEENINRVILESKDGRQIGHDIIDTFKRRAEVISAAYPLEYLGGTLHGIMNEFGVKLLKTTSYAQLQELAEKHNCIIGEEYSHVNNSYKVYVSKTSELNALQMANLFYETGLFEVAQPGFIYINAQTFVNDPLYSLQWYLKNTVLHGGIPGIDIKAEQAWAITTGSANIRIAHIDGGVYADHPDLQANLLSGYDAEGNNPNLKAIQGDHGTNSIGLIVASQNNIYNGNYEGITGVAPNCKVIPIYISTTYGISYQAMKNGIDWAWQYGEADVISLSWGGGYDYWVTQAIIDAATQGRGGKGCIITAGTGDRNSSSVYWPANLPEVIAVGAMDRFGKRWVDYIGFGSHYGTDLNVVAPSETNGTWTTSFMGTGWYTDGFGQTSAAAPQVAGIAALILSVNPDLYGYEVKNIIESTAQKVNESPAGIYTYAITPGKPNGTWHEQVGYGLVDAYAALLAVPILCVKPFNNETVTTNNSVTAVCEIIAGNVTVSNNAKLTLQAPKITINAPFEVQAGSSLTLTN